MRPPSVTLLTTRVARIGVLTLYAILLVGLSYEWLSFGWVTAFLALAFLLPLCWPRQAGSWLGILFLALVSWIASWGVQIAPSSSVGLNMLLLVMLSALVASPCALVLLMRRRSASAAVMLLGFALSIGVFTILLARIGPQMMGSSEGGVTSVAQLVWLPAMWFPTLAMCLGTLGFVVSLSWLVIREIGGNTQ